MLLVTASRPKSTRNRQMNARSRTSLKVGLVKLDPGVNMWSTAGIPVRRCCPGGPLVCIEASGIEEAVQEKVQPVFPTSRVIAIGIRDIARINTISTSGQCANAKDRKCGRRLAQGEN